MARDSRQPYISESGTAKPVAHIKNRMTSTAVVAVEIGVRLLYGLLEFEEALFVLVLAPEYYLPLRTLGVRFHAGMSGVTAAQRIFAVLETELDSDEQPRNIIANKKISFFAIIFVP